MKILCKTYNSGTTYAKYSPSSHLSPPLPKGQRHIGDSSLFSRLQPPPGPQSNGQGRAVEIGSVTFGSSVPSEVSFCSNRGPVKYYSKLLTDIII